MNGSYNSNINIFNDCNLSVGFNFYVLLTSLQRSYFAEILFDLQFWSGILFNELLVQIQIASIVQLRIEDLTISFFRCLLFIQWSFEKMHFPENKSKRNFHQNDQKKNFFFSVIYCFLWIITFLYSSIFRMCFVCFYGKQSI